MPELRFQSISPHSFLIFNRSLDYFIFFLPIQIHVLPTGIQYFADYLMTGVVGDSGNAQYGLTKLVLTL
jgi:hypothetical protein